MFLIKFGFYAPWVMKRDDYSITVINLIFFQVVIFTGQSKTLLGQLLRGHLLENIKLDKSILQEWKLTCFTLSQQLRRANDSIESLENRIRLLEKKFSG